MELSDEDSGKIARVVGFLLSQTHFKRAPLDDEISEAFLRKYMESLDYSRMVFLQSDYDEFKSKYGTLLDNLTKRRQRLAGIRDSKTLHQATQDRPQLARGYYLDRV